MTQKQMKAMQAQGYMITKCPDCFFYASDKEGDSEKNKRCTLGGFPVKKSGTCRQHADKETAEMLNYKNRFNDLS